MLSRKNGSRISSLFLSTIWDTETLHVTVLMISPHEAIYYLSGRSVQAVRVGDWKYRQAVDKAGKDGSKKNDRRPAEEERSKKQRTVALYNLRDDVGEKKNLVEQQPEIAARLKKRIERFATEFPRTLRPPGTAE